MKLSTNLLYGGVAGTVQASVMLAAFPNQNGPVVPLYDAAWIVMTAVTIAITRSYAIHVSSHKMGPDSHFWQQLGHRLLDGWPIVAACLPTTAVLIVAAIACWPESRFTNVGLTLNTVLLFGWGMISARSGGYRWGFTWLLGAMHATIGLLIIAANILIK